GRTIRPAASDRPPRDRRGERGDHRRVRPSGGCLCGLPLRDRARQADRADLEARVFRGRRRLDRRRDGGSRGSARTRRGRTGRMRVTVRLFARLRDVAGASELAREVAPGATVGAVWAQLTREFPDFAAYERSISSAVNADYARMDREVRDGDEIAFLPPVSGG